mgnify:CR=1 FL=1
MSVVEGNEVDLEVHLEQIFNDADTSFSSARVLEDEPKDDAAGHQRKHGGDFV